MCRKVLQFFVGFLLIVLIALATVLTILFVTFTSSDTYTTALADADVYTQLADSLQTSLTSYMTGGESADGGVQGDFFGGLPELISDQINA
ncbi:hypothetical protein KC640_01990, partial [Candidatus Dojkabacteria bacterium]|nr:hypothetical protein [Candidatus Dojkabacteria bacterium]